MNLEARSKLEYKLLEEYSVDYLIKNHKLINSVVKATEQQLTLTDVVGQSEQLKPMTEEMEIALENACKKVGKKSTNLKNRL